MHRIASSERYHASLIEIQTQWSLQDVMDAHEVLDLYEYETAKATKQAEKGR